MENPLVLLVQPVTTGLVLLPSLWSLKSRYRSASCSLETTLLSIILSLCSWFSPLPHIFDQKNTCPFRFFSISIISFLVIFASLPVCTSPILSYSSQLTTQSLEDLSVLRTTSSWFLILFCRLLKPSFSSGVRFPLTSPFLLQNSSLYSL